MTDNKGLASGQFINWMKYGLQVDIDFPSMIKVCKTVFTAILIAISSFSAFAQVDIKWTKEFTGSILWQEVTALGNLIVCTDYQLLGIDPETGDIRWNRVEHAGLIREAYSELSNSPFFTVTTNNSIHLIDQFSGDEVFNSNKAGIATIDDYFLLYNSDVLLVPGKNADRTPIMVAAKMSDGSISWTMNEKFGRIIAAIELGSNELLIVTLFSNYKIDALTGEVIWKEANSPESAQTDKFGALGSFMKSAAETMVQDMDFELYYYRPAGSDVFYLGSEEESESSMGSSGKPITYYSNIFNAFNLDDGSLVWKNALKVNGRFSQVTFLDNGILVLPNNGNNTKINLYDYKTHSGIWGKKGRGLKIKGGIYDFLEAGDGILLVSQTSSKNYLNYLDPNSGTITFDKPVKVDGQVIGIAPLSTGLLYITTNTMNILDQRSGTLKWGKSIKTNPRLTAEYGDEIFAFDYKSGTLKVVDKKSATVKELSSAALKFQGKEAPQYLEVMDDGIFIRSDQNVAKFSFEGSLLYQEYYPAPREPGWKRALLYAEAVRGAYISTSAYFASGVMAAVEDDVKKEDAVAGEMVSQIGNAYGELGAMASNYAKSAFNQANSRLKATLSTKTFMLVMSQQDKTIQLLKINKSNGQIGGSIDLGKDREPVYAVDDVTGQVYYRSGSKTLTSYMVR